MGSNEQIKVIEQLNSFQPRRSDDDVGDIVDLMEEYLKVGGRLEDLVEQYGASPLTSIATGLIVLVHRRTFTLDPSIATSIALRIVHLHTSDLQPGAYNMLGALIVPSTIGKESVESLHDLRRLVFHSLRVCTGSNPPIHFWPVLDLLEAICEAGLLDCVLRLEDRVYASERLTVAFGQQQSALDQDNIQKYDLVMESLRGT